MSKSKINKPWEQNKIKNIHSQEGVQELRKAIKFGLQKKYKGLAESMFAYDYAENPKVEDMLKMSQDTVPEMYLLKNGQCVWFEWAGQIHCLPLTYDGGINIYGKMMNWHPVPVGYIDVRAGQYDAGTEAIRNLNLSYDNSVIMRNDLFGGNDEEYIDAMIDELVDNTLTMNQLQLIAKAPFVFNVSEDNLPNAKLFYQKMSYDVPVIFTNLYGSDSKPIIESTNAKIDPALFELFDRFECQILEYLGFPCTPITKRAQQTVSEVQSNDDKIRLRRMEKLHQREQAIDRVNKLFGTNFTVTSVIDEYEEEQMQMMQQMQTIGQDKDGGEKDDRSS